MPLSKDPAARSRQLANLRRGKTEVVGNANARTHGAYAEITAAQLRGEELRVYEALAADAPVRDPDGGLPAADTLIVRQLAEARVRLQRISDHLLARGIEAKDGSLVPAVELDLRIRAHVLDLMRELGMTPKARVAMGVDLVRAATASDRLHEHLQRKYGAGDGESG